MSRPRKVVKVLSSTQLSFLDQIEKTRNNARALSQILMKDHIRNIKYIGTQIRLGDVEKEIKAKALKHIENCKEWLVELLDKMNGSYRIYAEMERVHFLNLTKEAPDLYTSYPFDQEDLSEMVERSISRIRGTFIAYADVTEPLFTDYVKGCMNQLKLTYYILK